MLLNRKIISFLAYLFCAVGSQAQNKDTVFLLQQPRWDSIYNMEEYARYSIDTDNKEEPGKLLQQQFLPDSNLSKTIKRQYGRKPVTAWTRWIIHNPSQQDEKVLLLFNYLSFFSFYYEDPAGLHLVKDNRSFFSFMPKDERRSVQLSVPAGATLKVYACMHNATKNFAREYPVIIRPGEYEQVRSKVVYETRYLEYMEVLFLAIIFFITLHTLAQYFFNRRKEFLLYAFYAFCVFAFFLFKFNEALYNDILFSYFPYIQKYGNNPLSYLMFFAYYRFVRTFINFKEIAPWFYRVIIVTEKILLAAIAADVILAVTNFYPVKYLLFNVLRSGLIVMAFTGIILLFRTRKPLPLFIAVGSGCFVLGALAAMVLSWINRAHAVFTLDPIAYMQLGMVIELLCFTLGLSYKTSLIEKEKDRCAATIDRSTGRE